MGEIGKVSERERWVGGGERGNGERGGWGDGRGRDKGERERGGCMREWEEWGRKEIGEGVCRSVEGLILAHKQSGQSEVMES